MLDALRKALLEMPVRKARVLVAVSGGADSVALARGLHAVAPEFGLALAIGHVNHGLRGAESDEDEASVRRLAAELGMGFLLRRVAPLERVGDGISLEMACRTLRTNALREMAGEVEADTIALGHHLRDQAETVLLRLCRGGSMRGLACMAPVTRRGDFTWIRPWLDTEPAQLRAWLKAGGHAWREDSSNETADPRRNRIRLEVLPLLEERINSSVVRHLAAFAEQARAENEVVLAEVDRLQAWLEGMGAHGPELNLQDLRRQDLALQRRLIALWWEKRGLASSGLTFAWIERIRILDTARAGSLDLPGGKVLAWDAHTGIRVSEKEVGGQVPAFFLRLPWEGRVDLLELGLSLSITRGTGYQRTQRQSPAHYPSLLQLSARRIEQTPLSLRTWHPGDRLQPHGGKETKVHDVYINHKVPRSMRSRIPLLVTDNEVVAVPGGWIAEGWQVESPSAPCVRLRFDPLDNPGGGANLELPTCEIPVLP